MHDSLLVSRDDCTEEKKKKTRTNERPNERTDERRAKGERMEAERGVARQAELKARRGESW